MKESKKNVERKTSLQLIFKKKSYVGLLDKVRVVDEVSENNNYQPVLFFRVFIFWQYTAGREQRYANTKLRQKWQSFAG
ncbi:MAG TPA: hypothetical protein EYO60_07175 [Candidatus Lambdaproteobacteria bacterium]|nr:hypothetical protein [Candidatus Lambdaproteobacteria bacterium]